MILDSKIPGGPLEEKWTRYQRDLKLVNPANKRKFTVIVVGTGLAGGSAAATLAELGYNVLSFCIQDSPRRARPMCTVLPRIPTRSSTIAWRRVFLSGANTAVCLTTVPSAALRYPAHFMLVVKRVSSFYSVRIRR